MNKVIKNFAGLFFRWKSACFILMALLLTASCNEDPIGQPAVDGRRPSPVLAQSVVAVGRPGGAYIFYELPDDDTDISYVKGEFEIDGEKQTVRSSVYKNYLAIDGLDSHKYVEIDLYVVDHSENVSDPVRTKFITYDAPYTTMRNSIQMMPAVGGVSVRWESPNYQYQYYASMGYLSSSYDSDVGVVLLVEDHLVAGKMTELAVSFSAKCSFLQPVIDAETRLYGAYTMDKWGHYSDTLYMELTPIYEQWLNRRNMKAYYIGDDNQTFAEYNPNHVLGYYSPMASLFDSLTYCLQPNTPSIHSGNYYMTHPYRDPVAADAAGAIASDKVEWTKPFYFTMDLGVIADVSRFWIGLPTHSRNDRFWEYSHGSPYDFELWGTLTDFGEDSDDYIPADDPYWTSGRWQMDPRWRYMGQYYNRRPNVPGDSPGNYTTAPPEELPVAGNKIGEDPAWDVSKQTREMGYGVRYFADGSGPVQNDEFYFPDASVHFAITEAAVGPVRYVRWQINETWEQTPYVRFSELWYWGGIVNN
jgi:hypothetical protein